MEGGGQRGCLTTALYPTPATGPYLIVCLTPQRCTRSNAPPPSPCPHAPGYALLTELGELLQVRPGGTFALQSAPTDDAVTTLLGYGKACSTAFGHESRPAVTTVLFSVALCHQPRTPRGTTPGVTLSRLKNGLNHLRLSPLGPSCQGFLEFPHAPPLVPIPTPLCPTHPQDLEAAIVRLPGALGDDAACRPVLVGGEGKGAVGCGGGAAEQQSDRHGTWPCGACKVPAMLRGGAREAIDCACTV